MFTLLLFPAYGSIAQTLIATSNHGYATAHHNQRKIVRDSADNLYVAYLDYDAPHSIIKGVVYNSDSGLWGDPFEIIEGDNPTLAISSDNKIHLVFGSDEATSEIRYMSTFDFINWTDYKVVSDNNVVNLLPVADVDSTGDVNVFWIQRNGNLTESLRYARISGDSVAERKSIVTKNKINDIAIANHLQYLTDDLFFAIQFDQDSLQFFWSDDKMESFDTVYSAMGSQPCISLNSEYENHPEHSRAVFLHRDTSFEPVEAEFLLRWDDLFAAPLQIGPVEYLCIDNLAPPIGYSYLFMQDEDLFHGFSYGPLWDQNEIMESIYDSWVMQPSIVYKQFNFEYVDFIYALETAHYDIYHMRDDKHIYINIEEDKETGKGFSITGYPNPFSENLFLNVSLEMGNETPGILIYNTNSQLIRSLSVEKSGEMEYAAQWDGTLESGEHVKPGIYLILCSVGDKRTARKVLYQP